MNIALIGYRGTGKSTVAAILGEELGWPVVSTDDLIVKREGPIPEIVARQGWEYFRDIEEQVVCELCKRNTQVIDCGGGAVIRRRNREALARTAFVVWLTASTETIIKRIKHDDQRPSLSGSKSFTDEVAEVLAQREPLYSESSSLTVATDTVPPEAVAREIIIALRTRKDS